MKQLILDLVYDDVQQRWNDGKWIGEDGCVDYPTYIKDFQADKTFVDVFVGAALCNVAFNIGFEFVTIELKPMIEIDYDSPRKTMVMEQQRNYQCETMVVFFEHTELLYPLNRQLSVDLPSRGLAKLKVRMDARVSTNAPMSSNTTNNFVSSDSDFIIRAKTPTLSRFFSPLPPVASSSEKKKSVIVLDDSEDSGMVD